MRRVVVVWLDSRSEGGWVEKKDLDMESSKITTIGHLVDDDGAVVCIASSIDAYSGLISGLVFIPQECVLTCEDLEMSK